VRPARTGARARLADKSVSLQTNEMRADGIVGEAEFGCEVIDRSVALPEQDENLSAGTFDQPFTPW
jgi:hypothetical protein